MAYPDDGLATHIASPAGGWEPQRDGMGVVQLTVPAAVNSGDVNTIMLAVKTASLPAREIDSEVIQYLAGYSNVATKPATPEAFTMSVHDYVDVNVYQTLYDWNQLVFNQRTGWLGFASSYKSNGVFLEFGPAPVGGSPQFIRRWELVGIWPKTQIPQRELNYEQNAPVTLDYSFAVDDYIYLGVS